MSRHSLDLGGKLLDERISKGVFRSDVRNVGSTWSYVYAQWEESISPPMRKMSVAGAALMRGVSGNVAHGASEAVRCLLDIQLDCWSLVLLSASGKIESY